MNKKYLAAGLGLGAVGGVIGWKFLSRASEVNWDDVSEYVPHSENSQFAEVDGLRVHYQEFGVLNDPTILLIHGYAASAFVWRIVAPLLAENGFHIIAVDLIGFGYSSKPAWFDYTIASQARIVSRLMNCVGIGRAGVVGTSYGGAVAATLALDYAERVEKLILVDAVINDEPKNHPILKVARIPGVGEFLAPFFIGSKMFMRRRMRGTLHETNHHLITPERIEGIRRPLHAADAHHSVLQTGRNWDANRVEADAHLINQPTLIIWGANDTVIPTSDGEKLFDSMLHSRFVVFQNCGHSPQEEKPDDFVNVVTEFLTSEKIKSRKNK